MCEIVPLQVTWQLATNARSFIANMPERIDSILPIDSFGASYVVANANTTLSQVGNDLSALNS